MQRGPTRCGAAGVDDNAPPESCDVIVELRDMRMMRMMMSPSYCGEQGTRGTRMLCSVFFFKCLCVYCVLTHGLHFTFYVYAIDADIKKVSTDTPTLTCHAYKLCI